MVKCAYSYYCDKSKRCETLQGGKGVILFARPSEYADFLDDDPPPRIAQIFINVYLSQVCNEYTNNKSTTYIRTYDIPKAIILIILYKHYNIWPRTIVPSSVLAAALVTRHNLGMNNVIVIADKILHYIMSFFVIFNQIFIIRAYSIRL